MKKIFYPLFLILFLASFLYSQEDFTIARRMKILIVDLESQYTEPDIMSGKILSDQFEQYAFESQPFIEKSILVKRETIQKPLSNFKLDDILGIIQKGQELGVEAILTGKVTKNSNGLFTIQVQLIDVQKKNIPSTRRIINFAETKDAANNADSLTEHIKKLVSILEGGNFPRVDIITPNFDVVSINQINKDEFPEMKLSVSVVNKNGEPVSIPPDLFEIRENSNMVLAEIQKVKTSQSVYTPITLVLVIDRSPSMLEELDGKKTGQPFKRAKAAALEFVSKLSSQDKIKIIAFDYEPLSLGDFTEDKNYYVDKLNNLEVGKGTGLYNILKYSVEAIADVKGEKAVILLTDGKNDVRNASEQIKSVTLSVGLNLAQKQTIPVYTIGFGDADEKVLGEVASKTHSMFFKAISSEKLMELYMKLHKIIENQYIIVYKSLADKSGKVQVSLNIKEDEREFTLTADEKKKGETYKQQLASDKETTKYTLQKKEVESIQKNIEKEKVTIETQKKVLDELKNKIDKEEKELQKKQTEYSEKEKNLNKKSEELDALKKELDSRKSTIDSMEKQLTEKQNALAASEEKLKAEQMKLEANRKETMQIQENIRKANQEILDFLKLKYDYIESENQKLNNLNNPKEKGTK